MALAMLAAACDGEDVPLPKQVVNIPLTGGLDTASGPLTQTPGSFLQLDDVRQERLHEWRNRQAITHADALDDVPATSLGNAPMLLSAQLPGGGLVGLNARSTAVTSGAIYARSVPAGAQRWTRNPSSQATPSAWVRRAVGVEDNSIQLRSMAVGNGYRLVAWKPAGLEIHAALISDTEGAVVTNGGSIVGTINATVPTCVYESSSKRFFLFYIDGANLAVSVYDAATGTFTSGGTVLKTNAVSTGWLDALVYSNSHITVVYRQTGGNARQLEVNPTSLALDTDVDLGVNCDNTLQLLQDPDSSGVRFVAVGTSAPDVRVLRTTTAAAITTNTQAAIASIDNVIGSAYQSGAGWMIVYHDLVSGSLKAVKFRSSVVSAAVTLTPGYGTAAYLDSNAWREPSTDVMHYIAGLHLGGVSTSPLVDQQAFYYEMALEFENGSSSISNLFTEPQARLLPQNAGLPSSGSARPQPTRTATGKFAVPLLRLAQATIVSGLLRNQWAVDMWDVTSLSTAIFANNARPNLGVGLTGSQAAYLPAGSLLQSATGALLVAHGSSAIPFRPTLAALAGAGLTVGQSYQYIVTDERIDDAGNVWRGPPSVASLPIIPTAGNARVTITASFATFEHALRYRIVKLWRTLGNGSLYQLVEQRQILSDATNGTASFTDLTPDSTLALSSFLPFRVAGDIAGTLPTMITPAFNHLELFDGRMWGAERDYPKRLRFTRKIQGGISPEFVGEFFIDFEDDEGDITGLAALDDKLIVFKDSAFYFLDQGGPNDDGSGGSYTVVKVSSEDGAMLGTPYISTGSHAWFVTRTGVKRVDRSLHVDDIGAPIDKYFNQPLVQTPEMPLSFTLNQKRGEVRLLTTNYRFVYDLAHASWMRDTGGPAGTLCLQRYDSLGDMFIRSNGQIWWDYDVESLSSLLDGGTAVVNGVIRSPWLRPAQPEGYMRLYGVRSLWKRDPEATTTTWPVTRIYFNDWDSDFDAPPVISGTSNIARATIETRVARMKLASFSIGITLPPGDLRWRLSQWSVLIAIKKSFRVRGGDVVR